MSEGRKLPRNIPTHFHTRLYNHTHIHLQSYSYSPTYSPSGSKLPRNIRMVRGSCIPSLHCIRALACNRSKHPRSCIPSLYCIRALPANTLSLYSLKSIDANRRMLREYRSSTLSLLFTLALLLRRHARALSTRSRSSQ